ncbi:hypothetical protein QP093_07310 [Pauljensenia sp. UMB10120]|nr:hypothetical protein [Pauljensenia sp. UMB10120]
MMSGPDSKSPSLMMNEGDQRDDESCYSSSLLELISVLTESYL